MHVQKRIDLWSSCSKENTMVAFTLPFFHPNFKLASDSAWDIRRLKLHPSSIITFLTNTSLKGKCAYSLGQQTIQYWTVGIYIQFRHSMSTTLSNYFLNCKWKISDSDISFLIKPSTALIQTLFNRVLLLGDLEHTINWHKSVIPYATNKITLKLLLFSSPFPWSIKVHKWQKQCIQK